MPKPVTRFRLFLSVLLVLQVLSVLPALATRPTYVAVQLCAAMLWIALAMLALRGSETSRKVLVGMSCLSAGAALLQTVGLFVFLVQTMSPIYILTVCLSALSFVLCIGVVSSVTDDKFRSWVRSQAFERANTRLAAA